MNKSRLKVIKGTQKKLEKHKYKFVSAHVTNTRLMGVMGLRIKWKNEEEEIFYQFFHLDSEEFGLDDYKSVMGEQTYQVQKIMASMMGGLGGRLISLTKKQALYLVQEFIDKNKNWQEPLPEPEEEYLFLVDKKIVLSEEETKNLWDKICEPIESVTQLIHYFVMRGVGMDQIGMDYLSTKDLGYMPVDRPSALIKNTIEKIEHNKEVSYMTESLIDVEDHYEMVISEIKVDEESCKIIDAVIQSNMRITMTEAAFTLTRREYLLVYDVEDLIEMISILDEEKMHAMKHSYPSGYLYTEFYPTNDHVKQETYYLNGDVYGVYYITLAHQFVVACYNEKNLKEIQREFGKKKWATYLDFRERIEVDHSLIYEFVHSEYDNIFDFLEK
ncbi:hypothetical protein [Inediibacterium massiliense]|uniref:hypothetical protein n=1 Tax=Inediibacterium massiliense TaxID=1658111 RepID=UPI0006B4EF75|nr:hypothetical protein [Inediibacterium massiliense]